MSTGKDLRIEKFRAKIPEKLSFLKRMSQKQLLLLTAFLLVVAVIAYFKEILVILGIIIIGVFSRIPQKMLPVSVGIELCTFLTILTGLAYGPLAGGIVGFSAMVLSKFLKRIFPFALLREGTPVLFIAGVFMGLTGVMSGYLAGSSIASSLILFGMLMTLFYDLISSVAFTFMGATVFQHAIFISTHLAFNYFLFSRYGEIVLGLIV